jgi:hypothetical protein
LPLNAPNPHVQGEVLCEFSSYGAYALTGAAGASSATLAWTDPFSTETGWLVEQRQKTGKFTQIRTLPANATASRSPGSSRAPIRSVSARSSRTTSASIRMW